MSDHLRSHPYLQSSRFHEDLCNKTANEPVFIMGIDALSFPTDGAMIINYNIFVKVESIHSTSFSVRKHQFGEASKIRVSAANWFSSV